jgi:hypothetical protein
MLRWKQVLGAIFVPLVVYAYSPVKEHVFDYYATRWYHHKNPSDRTTRVRVRNLSSGASLPITVRLGDSKSKIADFEYADPWDGPRVRYLNSTRHSETLRQFDLSLKRPILLDEHLVTSSLEDIEGELKTAALDRSVPSRLKTADLLKEMTFPNHLLWLEQCRLQSPSAHPCCMERAWEKWEYILRGIQGDEITFWKQVAGVQLGFSDYHLMPHGRTDFVLALPIGHSALLQVQYEYEPVRDDVLVFTTEGLVLQVKNENDLDRSVWWMFFLYPQPEYSYGALISVLALLTVPLWVPLKYLNTYTLVNRALGKGNQLDTASEWDEVYGRIKFSLKDKFDSYRTTLGKPSSALSADVLFDFLRGYLLLAYQGGIGRFQNEKQLQSEINRGLLTLANV